MPCGPRKCKEAALGTFKKRNRFDSKISVLVMCRQVSIPEPGAVMIKFGNTASAIPVFCIFQNNGWCMIYLYGCRSQKPHLQCLQRAARKRPQVTQAAFPQPRPRADHGEHPRGKTKTLGTRWIIYTHIMYTYMYICIYIFHSGLNLNPQRRSANIHASIILSLFFVFCLHAFVKRILALCSDCSLQLAQ